MYEDDLHEPGSMMISEEMKLENKILAESWREKEGEETWSLSG